MTKYNRKHNKLKNDTDLDLNLRSISFNMNYCHLKDDLPEPQFPSYVIGKIMPMSQIGETLAYHIQLSLLP